MSDKYIKNEMDRELLLNIQIQKQVLSVLPKMNVSKQFISPTTQEMIDDYKKQFKRPGFKFQIPSYEPELETVEDLEEVFTDTVLAGKMKELEDNTNEFREINNVIIPKIEDDIRINRDKYNNLSSFDAPNAFKLSKELRELGIQRRETVQRLAELRGLIDTLNQDIQENNIKKESNIAKITSATQNNKQKIKDYNNTLNLLNFNNIDISQKPGESEEDFLNRLTALGLIEDDPNDAILFNINEFKKNMKTIINQEWMIENILKSLNSDSIFYINLAFPKFKKKFTDDFGINNKQFILDDYLFFIRDYIEKETTSDTKSSTSEKKSDVYNTINNFYGSTQDYQYYEPAPETKEYEDNILYGTNPVPEPVELDWTPIPEVKDTIEPEVENASSSVETDYTDIVKKLEKVVEKRKSQPKPLEIETPIKAKLIEDKPIIKNIPIMPKFNDIKVSVQGNVVEFSDDSGPVLLLSTIEKDKTNNYLKGLVTFSRDGGSFYNVVKDNREKKQFAKTFKDILKMSGFNDKDTNLFLNSIKSSGKQPRPNYKKLYDLIDNEIKNKVSGSGITGKALQGFKKPEKQKKKPTVHKGKSLKDVPSHCEFGKLILLLNKLYHKNILSVKDANNINVQGIPNTKVSNKFVNLLMKICTDKNISKKDISILNQKEMILYNVLISKAGLSKDFDVNIKKTIKTLKNRLQLIEGEIVAGNNNDDLKKELYDVVFKLSHIGAIAISAARKYYNETLKLYFKK